MTSLNAIFNLLTEGFKPLQFNQRTEIVTYTKQYTRKGVRIVPLEVRALPGNSRGKARR